MNLVIVDVQERLTPAMAGKGHEFVHNVGRLVRAARLLDIGLIVTEQNPARLGPTLPALQVDLSLVIPKMEFDASGLIRDRLVPGRVIVCGCEAHICVLQTVFGLLRTDREVQVAADATGSRRDQDRELALRRMERAGAEVITTEMLVFEALGSADHPRFCEAMNIVK